jgi:uroporphyrinogen-III synthase
MAADNLHPAPDGWCARWSPSLLPQNSSLNWPSPHFGGLRVVAFETRRADAMRALIEMGGGTATLVPCVREVPLSDSKTLTAFQKALLDTKLDASIFTTEHGARLLLNSLENNVRSRVASTHIIARSNVVASVLQEFKLPVTSIAPQPHTWREILSSLEKISLAKGSRVALQEAGLPNRSLAKALQTRGVQLLRVPVYRWALPEDVTLLVRAMNNVAEGNYDVALFTAATQVWHLFKLAYRKGMEEELRAGFKSVLVASVGPVTSEALREFEIEPDLQATSFDMDTLVRETAFASHALLEQKRRQFGLLGGV